MNSILLIKSVTKTVESEVKKQKRVFLGMFVATSITSLLGNMSAGKGVLRAGEGTNF